MNGDSSDGHVRAKNGNGKIYRCFDTQGQAVSWIRLQPNWQRLTTARCWCNRKPEKRRT